MDRRGAGWAPARAALAGNPSDAYGGAVLALALSTWSVRAQATPSNRLAITPLSALVEATVRRFAQDFHREALRTSVRWESSIPRGVGLAGSSALIIAVLRALADLFGLALSPNTTAALALAVEVEDLGIMAGPQDRVVQAYGGLMFMDFGEAVYEQLEPGLLPPILIAWHPEAGGHSGHLHSALRDRHRAGEPLVLDTMDRLARTARQARAALLEGDLLGFGDCMDLTLDLRQGMLALDPVCLEMVDVARQQGATVNYAGSGGAIASSCPDAERFGRVEAGLQAIGCRTAWAIGHDTVTSG
jgi:glucuronokinase